MVVRKARPRRTFSASGDVRRTPSKYETLTRGKNWTARSNRAAACEQDVSSAAHLRFLTYRDNSVLKADDLDAFRDPPAVTYRPYVTLQSDAEAKVQGALEAHVLMWFLAEDPRRRSRWSRALADLAATQRPDNAPVFRRWICRWSRLARRCHRSRHDLEHKVDGQVSAVDVVAHVPGHAKTISPSCLAAQARHGSPTGVTWRRVMTTRWRDAIDIDDLWEGEMTPVMIAGEPVLLVNIGGTLRAYSNKCPHQASPLNEGNLDGERLTCARHLWEFNALTGRGINPADAQLTRYGCKVGNDGTIYVDIGR